MEAAAIGVPLYATNCLPYNRVMPESQLFSTSTELKEKLTKLKFSSAHIYRDIIERQWQWLNSTCVEGDFLLKNYWLEDNLMNVWMPLFRLRQKGLKISFKSFSEQYTKRKEEEAKKLLFASESGKAKVTL